MFMLHNAGVLKDTNDSRKIFVPSVKAMIGSAKNCHEQSNINIASHTPLELGMKLTPLKIYAW